MKAFAIMLVDCSVELIKHLTLLQMNQNLSINVYDKIKKQIVSHIIIVWEEKIDKRLSKGFLIKIRLFEFA